LGRRIKAAILGPGNIGTDLMFKILKRGANLRLEMLCGIQADSKGLALARENGIATSANGIDDILGAPDIRIAFDATSAAAHTKHARLFREADITVIDLTPAAIGPYVIPVVNLDEHLNSPNLNLVTCGGQAAVPIVKAITRVAETPYAEIVAVMSSKSAGPGTRRNIDEYTQTTARAIVELGGTQRGKAIILLNPAEPPMTMSSTIYAKVERSDQEAITDSVDRMVSNVQSYVPGYRLKMPPQFDGDKVTVMIEVEGAGDYLPTYSGNLDIETCAALAVGEAVAGNMLDAGGAG